MDLILEYEGESYNHVGQFGLEKEEKQRVLYFCSQIFSGEKEQK